MRHSATFLTIVPYSGSIVQQCEAELKRLEGMGLAVWRVPGYSAIDLARSELATQALDQGAEEILWIDSDIGFRAEDVLAMRKLTQADLPPVVRDPPLALETPLDIVAGLYPKKGKRELAAHVLSGTSKITFGNEGGLLEMKYVGAGFLLVRRAAYEAIQQKFNLPRCNLPAELVAGQTPTGETKAQTGGVIPFFQPLTVAEENGRYRYLCEDYAFCHRAREAGLRIWADTRIRLWHYGQYGYGWEDAGSTPTRYGTYHFEVTDGAK